MRLESTILTDLSANVFAALLLILLILLQVQSSSAPPIEPDTPRSEAAARTMDASRDLKPQPRRPMDPSALIAFLYDRRADAPGLSLDLTEDGVDLEASGNGPVRLAPDRLSEALRRVDPEAPIRLYVLSHRHADAVFDVLIQSGRHWRDLSIPRALRDGRGAWAPAFLALLAQRRGLGAFRADLARLLGAGPGADTRGSGGASGASPSEAIRPGLLDTVRAWFRIGSAILALIGGFATVLAIEFVVPAPVPNYAAGSTSKDVHEGEGS